MNYRALVCAPQCQHCGKFIAWKDTNNGNALYRMDTPDSDVSSESWTILCQKHKHLDWKQPGGAK